jgi:5-methylcytosine-specific restriction enzyme subunit McrC
VAPTFDRRRYRLTARGYVGFVTVGGQPVEFRPKRPWAEVRCLFQPASRDREGAGEVSHTHGPSGPGSPELLDLLARRLADLMLARAAAGLLRGYVEREVTEGQVRGRIDVPKQVRHGWRQPGVFGLRVDEFTPDVAWNRIPKATAVRLLSEPGLTGPTREALTRAVAAFAGVSDTPWSVSEPTVREFDARTEPYRELIGWCDLIGSGEVLVSLERAFELYAERLFRAAVGDWNLGVQEPIWLHLAEDPTPRPPPRLREGAGGWGRSLCLTPDLVVTRSGTPASVWDAKWKRPDPLPADAHQVIAYAALLGASDCGLVYPGRRFGLSFLRPASDSRLSVRLLRLPLTDDPARLRRAAGRLRRACRAGGPGA